MERVRSLLLVDGPDVDAGDPSSFDSERSGIQGTWNALGELGSGAYGKAHLWVKLDALGRPIDKAVIKSVYLGNRTGKDEWNNPVFWRTDVDDRRPMEYALPRSLNDLAESFNIVETRGYATYDPSKTYTIYLEYCPRGSLADLVKRYQKIRTLRDENGTPISGRIPVRVMWSIFEALASTVCLMYQGHFPGDGETSRNDFSAFVHRDIKPENIFLANPDSNFWPQVPVAKMGDFGLAVLADDVEKQGTNGWKAPEMIEYDAPFEDSEDEFLEDLPDYNQLYPPHVLCDVWSLGRVMLALMNLEDPVDVPELRFDEDDVAPGPFNDPPDKTSGKHDQSYYAGVKEYYPDEMRRLVERCLQMNPEDRVDPDTLWNEVHSHVAACKGLRGRPLREMQRDCLGRELLLMEHVETRDLVKGQWAT